jgi:hypothetical protein
MKKAGRDISVSLPAFVTQRRIKKLMRRAAPRLFHAAVRELS